MTVYLIHFSSPIGSERHQARHYLGIAEDLQKRLTDHAMGRGARLLEVLRERGIEWSLARVWADGDRALERRLKNFNGSDRFCPCCQGEAAYSRAHFGKPAWADPDQLEVVCDGRQLAPAEIESSAHSVGRRR